MLKSFLAAGGALLPLLLFVLQAFAQKEGTVRVFGEEIRENRLSNPADPRMGRGEVLAKLTRVLAFQNYAKENGLEPTDQEIEKALLSMGNIPQPSKEDISQSAVSLNQNLIEAGVDPQKREDAVTEFQINASSLQHQIRVHFVREMILNWKVARHLHQKHGGRIALNPIGYHLPIDAYAKYIQDALAKDKIQIAESELKSAFLSALQEEQKQGSIVEGEEGAAAAFGTQPW